MGIWNGLRQFAGKAIYWKSSHVPSDSNELPYLTSLPEAVSKISDIIGPQKLMEFVPSPDQREKISRVLMGLGKFAVDSAINDSFKGVNGGIQVYKIVKEGLKDPPPQQLINGNKKPEHALVMEEMQAKIEKMQEELNFIKLQNGASIQCVKESDLTKEASAEPNEGSPPTKADVRKTFIRSRL